MREITIHELASFVWREADNELQEYVSPKNGLTTARSQRRRRRITSSRWLSRAAQLEAVVLCPQPDDLGDQHHQIRLSAVGGGRKAHLAQRPARWWCIASVLVKNRANPAPLNALLPIHTSWCTATRGARLVSNRRSLYTVWGRARPGTRRILRPHAILICLAVCGRNLPRSKERP
jgi:hypothetical protein